MNVRPDTIRVSIYGREYSIRGDADPGYIREIAHYLDMKMRQMTDNTTVPSTAKVAILAALNITDELFQRERQIRETADDRESAVSVLAARIERTLSELSQPPSFKASPDTLEIEELQQIETSDRA
ncbi:MAG: cell division protein ZapA [Candidatus Fermentibacter sp.]|nr:cell division protein ZapA [Candidatus Fermentibacter sp.]MCC6870808.1 cell division protein ZapA [Candidatus Fermentibacter sp.]NLI01857.1 cell division protein ZapA [Candidatus Fermentibacter daniensis]OQC70208.1 MAG: Cell division protein ZapA [candidate division Hyd24-12 bacterium ADurb.Bin004]